MSDKRVILYRDGTDICLMVPIEGSAEEAARRDVPAGCPYIIESRQNLPSEVEYIEAWDVDFSTPDGWGQDVQLAETQEGSDESSDS